MTFIKISTKDYKYIYNRIKYYANNEDSENPNGMTETLSTVDQDYLDDITSSEYEKDSEEHDHQQSIRLSCLEDACELLHFMVYESGAKYNKVPDKQFLRRVEPLLTKTN